MSFYQNKMINEPCNQHVMLPRMSLKTQKQTVSVEWRFMRTVYDFGDYLTRSNDPNVLR